MRIPEIQEQLRELSATIGVLAEELSRRSPTKRAQATSEKVTPELARAVKMYARLNPDETQAEVGKKFNINPGRVSEILRGKRK